MTEDETSIVQGIILAMALFLLPLVLFLSDRFEKKQAYIIAAGTWIVVMIALFFVPKNVGIPIYIYTSSLRWLDLAFLPLITLKWANYVQPTADDVIPVQPPSALFALRILVSIVPAVFLILSIIVAKRYPITRARYAEIEQELELKRQAHLS